MIYWYDIKTTKPKIDQTVIVSLNWDTEHTFCFEYKGVSDDTGKDIWYWHNSDERSLLEVVAWTPMPKPVKYTGFY